MIGPAWSCTSLLTLERGLWCPGMMNAWIEPSGFGHIYLTLVYWPADSIWREEGLATILDSELIWICLWEGNLDLADAHI